MTGDFQVGSQHSWFRFDFKVAVGEHTLRAVSKTGMSDKTISFRLNETRWAVVDFWYEAPAKGGAASTPQQFSIELYDEEPKFS